MTNTIWPGPLRQQWALPEGKPLTLVAAGPDHVAAAMQEGTIVLHDRKTGQAIREWHLDQALVTVVSVGETNQELVAVAGDGTVVLLDPQNDEALQSVGTGLAVTHAGRWFGLRTLWLRQDRQIMLLDLETSRLRPAPGDGPWLASASSPSGDRLLVTREDGPAVLLTETADEASPSAEYYPEDLPYDLVPAFAPDGKAWALAGEDTVWIEQEAGDGRVQQLRTGITAPRSVAFLPRGRSLGIASRGLVTLLQRDTGKVLHRWSGLAAPAWLPLGSDVLHTLTPGVIDVCDAGAY